MLKLKWPNKNEVKKTHVQFPAVKVTRGNYTEMQFFINGYQLQQIVGTNGLENIFDLDLILSAQRNSLRKKDVKVY